MLLTISDGTYQRNAFRKCQDINGYHNHVSTLHHRKTHRITCLTAVNQIQRAENEYLLSSPRRPFIRKSRVESRGVVARAQDSPRPQRRSFTRPPSAASLRGSAPAATPLELPPWSGRSPYRSPSELVFCHRSTSVDVARLAALPTPSRFVCPVPFTALALGFAPPAVLPRSVLAARLLPVALGALSRRPSA